MLLATGVALGQSGGGFAVARQSIDSGGARSSGGGFALVGTVGQADAARGEAGSFQLQGGFHRRGTGSAPVDVLFANGFE
jgi:hypothetical protein